MPQSALANVKVDYRVRRHEIPPLLLQVTSDEVPTSDAAPSRTLDVEVKVVMEENPVAARRP